MVITLLSLYMELKSQQLYTCIDSIVSPISRECMSPTWTIKGNLVKFQDEVLGALDKGGVLGLSFVVFTIFGIKFCKVRASVVTKRNSTTLFNLNVKKINNQMQANVWSVYSTTGKANFDMIANQFTISLATINGDMKRHRPCTKNKPIY